MKPSSKVFWGMAALAALAGPAPAAPGLPVPGFQIVSPPQVALRPVPPRAMTPATRADVERRQRHGRPGEDRNRAAAGGLGGFGIYTTPAGPDALVGEPPRDPYVISGPPREACLGPGPLIIEVGKPLPTPTNLPRVVYGTPTPLCPPGY